MQPLQGITSPNAKITAISKKKNTLAVGSSKGKVWIFQLENNQLKSILNEEFIKSHNSKISALTFNPDGTKLVSASHDRTAKIWNINHLYEM